MTRRLLDLYCGAGGAARGYANAGFEIVGVDINPQPRYPYTFIQADALEYLSRVSEIENEFDAIHTSAPCQAHTPLRNLHKQNEYVNLLTPTLALLEAYKIPWIAENVPGARAIMPEHSIILCGTMFDCYSGPFQLIRHRLFASNQSIEPPDECFHDNEAVTVTVTGNGDGGSVRGFKGDIGLRSDLMGIDWMTSKELSQAIPPAYTEYLANFL